jgi:hypothetical protein
VSSFIAERKMSGHYCLLLVAIAYLQGIEGGVVRQLPHPNAQKLPVVSQENDLSGKEENGPPGGSYLTTERPSQTLTVEQFQYPEYPEEESYFESDMTTEEELSYKKSMGIKTATLWPDGILYYDFSGEFLVEEKGIIE